MRFAVAALVIVALSAIWLITQYPDDGRPNEVLTGRDVMPVTMSLEPDRPIADQEAFEATIPGEVISDTQSIIVTVESEAFSEPVMRTSMIEFDPEQRVEIVNYLSKSGLAEIDAERIADPALNGTKECIGEAFGSDEATSTQIETCMFNVLAAHGLSEIALTD